VKALPYKNAGFKEHFHLVWRAKSPKGQIFEKQETLHCKPGKSRFLSRFCLFLCAEKITRRSRSISVSSVFVFKAQRSQRSLA
jgi:hypothetical protein